MNAERILVTGGAGFIGSHLCNGLLQAGYEVRVLDDLSVGKIENVPAGCELIRGSLLDEAIVDRALAAVTHVCHEAALVSVRESVEKFYEDARTNLTGTLFLLKKAAEHSIRRFVYASSMAVYADSENAEPINENHPAIPVSPYGVAKLAAERYVMLMGPRLGMEPIVLRYFNTFGARQSFTSYVGVITIFITRLLQKQDITIFGDGKQCRDFVHVSDVVQANLLSLKKPQAVGKVVNIGSGRGTTVMELATLLKKEIYPKAAIHHAPRREEELRNSIADISLAGQVLSYCPGTDLLRQIQEVIHYLR
jgi:UDP-glucose 4-epimerase